MVERGREVLGVDASAERVQHFADRLTHAIHVDTTDEEAMRQIGAADFQQAVVAIGTDIESSVLTTVLLSRDHGRILERIGAHHVVYPEADMGERVAHLVSGSMLDYIKFDDTFALAKLEVTEPLGQGSLGDLGLRARYGVTVVGIRSPGADFTYADRDTVITPGSLIAVAGRLEDVDRFAQGLAHGQ
jgi:trk system potassium uptake protein TrkA